MSKRAGPRGVGGPPPPGCRPAPPPATHAALPHPPASCASPCLPPPRYEALLDDFDTMVEDEQDRLWSKKEDPGLSGLLAKFLQNKKLSAADALGFA